MNNVLEINRAYTNNLIQSIFNYYNGKINVINYPAELIIDYGVNYDSNVSGNCRNPNKVNIFPFVVGRYCHRSIEEFNINLACTIIHELHHIDQDISFVRYREDSEYRQLIENQCNTEMYYFMLNHQDELRNLFNINMALIDEKHFKENAYKCETGRVFNRITFQSHMLSMIKDLVDSDDSDLIKNLSGFLYDPNSRILMRINDAVEFDIKNGMMGMPMAQLNSLMDQYIFIHPVRYCKISLGVDVNYNACLIDIKVKGERPMCHFAKPIVNPLLRNTIYSDGVLI